MHTTFTLSKRRAGPYHYACSPYNKHNQQYLTYTGNYVISQLVTLLHAAIPICREAGYPGIVQCITVNTKFLVTVFKKGDENAFPSSHRHASYTQTRCSLQVQILLNEPTGSDYLQLSVKIQRDQKTGNVLRTLADKCCWRNVRVPCCSPRTQFCSDFVCTLLIYQRDLIAGTELAITGDW